VESKLCKTHNRKYGPSCQLADYARITGNPEVISSPVGLLPTNAQVSTNRRALPEGRQSGSDRSSEICKEKAPRAPVQFGRVLAVRNWRLRGDSEPATSCSTGRRSNEQTKYVLTPRECVPKPRVTGPASVHESFYPNLSQ